ncbi:MAG: cell envelope integrity protein TolA [Hydrogenophaga sp.]|uniref:cell envelope integrity protein TolA n=1 Tax=Hydrogenophaga sp. TaxID=1904254 RepID=UPI002717A144|nr:cell envelope integrity protein TolA [Hydrogenophaga sp.]MDO9147491.1 cell envelope integrity protein TolA [Hydrogenophaga sp.]MDO9605676.1 cell envelope integrity protein TolA [Hydrogenophaga sp.]
MHSTTDTLNLTPPAPGRWLGPLGLALVVHGLLVVALTWGVGWQRDAPPVMFEAEIWSPAPQAAAPRAVEPPPPPPSPPAAAPRAQPQPAPKPTPTAPAPQPAPAPGPTQADIATAQAKLKAQADLRRTQAEAARKAAADKLAQDTLAAAQKAEAEKAAADRKAAADLRRTQAEAARKAAAEKERQQQLAQEKREKERQLAEEKRLDELAAKERDAQMRRIMGQAGASGGPQAAGTAQQSSGPSAAYGGRVAARIKPNVVFTEVVSGNPRAEVEVRTLPDGTITSRRIVKPSGSPAWDEAVLRAIDRTGTLPRDTDGRVPSSLIIGLRPLD